MNESVEESDASSTHSQSEKSPDASGPSVDFTPLSSLARHSVIASSSVPLYRLSGNAGTSLANRKLSRRDSGGNQQAALLTQNVYQKPLKTLPKDYKPPKFAKSDKEVSLIKKALKDNIVCNALGKKEMKPLIQAFAPCNYKKGDTIIVQGTPGDYFYIILSGKVEFLVDTKVVGHARKGKSFGELALMYTSPRAATVRAARDTKLFRVDHDTFRHIVQNQLKDTHQERLKLLRKVKIFEEMGSYELSKIAKVMKAQSFQKDDILVRKGDEGSVMYIIAEGSVLVKDVEVGSTTYENITMGPGDYLGERSLITLEPRAANAVALSEGVAYAIDRKTFEKVLGQISDLLQKANDSRMLSGVSVFQSAKLTREQWQELARAMRSDKSYKVGCRIVCKTEAVKAALYFVRGGRVKVEYQDGTTEIVCGGGYFGNSMLLLGEEKPGKRYIKPNLTATCIEAATISELRLADCRKIFDTHLLLGREATTTSSDHAHVISEDDHCPPSLARADRMSSWDDSMYWPTPAPLHVELEDLEKKKLLGEGSFGQVWMVTDEANEKEGAVYALKVQAKFHLIQEEQVHAVIQERDIMEKVNHPFIVNLISSFQDSSFLYLVFNLVQGGELFNRIYDIELDREGLPEEHAKFYGLCVADALAYLHKTGYVYRDLKPENIMIDKDGYPKLIDFGFAKQISEKTFTLCGTPGYLPPECITIAGHDWSADHWSFGILIYDMITGSNPFFFEGMSQMELYHSIVQDDPVEAKDASEKAKDLLSKLLQKDPAERLGSLAKGELDIFEHPWFDGLNLFDLRQRTTPAPWLPKLKDALDTSCFDNWDHLVDKMAEGSPNLLDSEQALFDKF